MSNEVIIEQRERVEPITEAEATHQVSKAHGLFFKAMNRKYVVPVNAPMEQLGTRHEKDVVQYLRGSKEVFSVYPDRYVAKKVSPTVTHRMMDMIAKSGHKRVRVTGKKGWRFQVWLYGSLKGIEVIGYEPSPKDRQILAFVRENETAIHKTKDEPAQTQEPTAEETSEKAPNEAKERGKQRTSSQSQSGSSANQQAAANASTGAEKTEQSQENAKPTGEQKQRTALSDYIMLPDPEQNLAAQSALEQLSAFSNLPKGDPSREKVFGEIVNWVAKLNQHSGKKLLVCLETFFTEDMVDTYVQAKMVAAKRQDKAHIRDMTPLAMLETLAQGDPLTFDVLVDDFKKGGVEKLVKGQKEHLKAMPESLQEIGKAFFGRIKKDASSLTDDLFAQVGVVRAAQTKTTAAQPTQAGGASGTHTGQIPVCVKLLETGNPKAMEVVKELVILYGTDIREHRTSFNSAVQQHLDNSRPQQRALSDQLYKLICNHFDQALPIIFEKSDPEAIRERLLKRFDEKLSEINAQLTGAVSVAKEEQLLGSQRRHQEWRARLVNGLPFENPQRHPVKQPSMT